jgi:RNA polymerase sigma-B factor
MATAEPPLPPEGTGAPSGVHDGPDGDVRDATDVGDGLDGFREYRRSGSRRLRNELVEANLEIVEPYVRRFDQRGVARDDLRQVAMLAVLKAVERFDPDYGVTFGTFAGRTIEGELKRHLRDRGWAVRPPRRKQEVYLAVRQAEEELTQTLGRAPTIAELARHTGETVDGVLEAIEAGGARHAGSIDAPQGPDRSDAAGTLVDERAGVGDVELRVLVDEVLEGLDERERTVIRMRFYEERSQAEIADELGLSQSFVSRLIRQTLQSARQRLDEASGPDDDDALPTG